MKLGLVLEGGASRTYFSCGAMDYLLEAEIFADYVIGVSAGISFGVSYCSRQIKRNLTILRKYEADKRYMGVRHFLDRKNKSYYNLEFVFEEIPNKLVPFDFDVFDNRRDNCVAVVTRLDSGQPEYIEMPKDNKFDVLKASCALPLLFQPVELNGIKYMDGGIADPIPFKKALDEGCDKLMVMLTHPRGYVKTKEKATPLVKQAFKKYPDFLETFVSRPERYNKCLKELEQLEAQGRAFVIAPEDTHGIGRTEKDPEILERFYCEGYLYCAERAEELKEFAAKGQKP